MSTGMSLYVMALVLINVIGCVWLLWFTTKTTPDDPAADSTTHLWDGDLEEYNNPLPRWWLYFFYITIVFAAIYLILYPGFGNLPGVLGWTQTGEYDQEVAMAEERYGEVFSVYADMPYEVMINDPKALALGRNQYANNCATCHGSDARGAKGFPNLSDNDWLWGGTPMAVEQSIIYGRIGAMPALGPAIGDQGVNDVIGYIRSLGGRQIDSARVDAGRQTYNNMCASCHGPDAKGNQALGAVNLTDDIWLHGAGDPDMRSVLMEGRTNQMPAHKDILSPDRIRVVTAYVLSLSNQQE
jgi:cytochrome c oxidase cbb3-type subunit 3